MSVEVEDSNCCYINQRIGVIAVGIINLFIAILFTIIFIVYSIYPEDVGSHFPFSVTTTRVIMIILAVLSVIYLVVDILLIIGGFKKSRGLLLPYIIAFPILILIIIIILFIAMHGSLWDIGLTQVLVRILIYSLVALAAAILWVIIYNYFRSLRKRKCDE